MLDKRTYTLLSIINEQCKEGTYKVLEIEELLDMLPSKFELEGDGLNQILNYLKEREYINIKYSDDKMYCLCPLPKGRQYFETEITEKVEKKQKYRAFLFTAFIGAMVGGIIGSILVAVIVRFIV